MSGRRPNSGGGGGGGIPQGALASPWLMGTTAGGLIESAKWLLARITHQ